MSAHESTAATVVYFEETGETREIVSFCARCFPEGGDDREAYIVGPRGVAHEGHWSGSDTTVCGKDATGPRWWHRL